MTFNFGDAARDAAPLGYSGKLLEKAFRLITLLERLSSHPFLKTRVALKGGAALNLLHADVPRLSVDIDLNYIGAADRARMLAERPKVEQAVHAVCSREGLTVRRMPSEHAGGKWRLTYAALAGGSEVLELDVNFMLRTPLWPPKRADGFAIGKIKVGSVSVLDPHELAAGKLAALLARSATRDIFDAHRLLASKALERAKLRLAFVIYGGINRKDWRTVSVADVKGDVVEATRELVPMLRSDLAPAKSEVGRWLETLVAECRERLAVVLPLATSELDFIQRLNSAGEIAPELLTEDAALQAVVREHPGLKWKALNVRKHIGAAPAKDKTNEAT